LNQQRGEQEVLYLGRGLHRVGQAKALSLYPMGLFRRQVTFSASSEVIVLPEIFSGVRIQQSQSPQGWSESGLRPGQSEDLHSLRAFRAGDDPRSIHWKQSARNDRLIFRQRSEEEARRVSVLVDSLVPEAMIVEPNRFEKLVSEAATACVEYLDRGYEVELVLREGAIGFGRGRWHRRRLLEALALLQCRIDGVAGDGVAGEQGMPQHKAHGLEPAGQTNTLLGVLEASDGKSHELRFSLAGTPTSDSPSRLDRGETESRPDLCSEGGRA